MIKINDLIVLKDVNGDKILIDGDEFLKCILSKEFTFYGMDIATIRALQRGYILNTGKSLVIKKEVNEYFNYLDEFRKVIGKPAHEVQDCDISVDFSEIHESILVLLVIDHYKQKHQDYPKHTNLELNRRAAGAYTSDGMLKIKIDKQCADIMEIFNHGLKYKK